MPDGSSYSDLGAVTDLNSTIKGLVQNGSQLIAALNSLQVALGTSFLALTTATLGLVAPIGALSTATLGANIGTTNSPRATILTTVSTTSSLAIAANSARFGIMFHSPLTTAVQMWVVPSTLTAVAGQGLLVAGGSSVSFPSTCGWNVIATSGTTGVMTVLEFV